MAFSASFSSITETSARFRASFTGGDSGFSYYRYVRLDIDRDTYEIRSDSVGGASSSFSETIRGLDPGTTYDWEAQLGYEDASGSITWLSIYDSGSFTTDSTAPGVRLMARLVQARQERPEMPWIMKSQQRIFHMRSGTIL